MNFFIDLKDSELSFLVSRSPREIKAYLDGHLHYLISFTPSEQLLVIQRMLERIDNYQTGGFPTQAKNFIKFTNKLIEIWQRK